MTTPSSPTIDQLISALAIQTSAAERFVTQVRELFTSKGIRLDSEAEPYREAITETFDRDRSLRENVLRARAAAHELQDDIEALSNRCRDQLQQLTRLSEAFEGQFPQLQAFAERLKDLRYYLAEFYVR